MARTKKNEVANLNEQTVEAQKINSKIVAMTSNGGYLKEGETGLCVRLHFIESVLGTAPMDPELYSNYIASKAPDAKSREEEIAMLTADGFMERAISGFLRDKKGRAGNLGYQMKGYLKEATKHEKRYQDSICKKWTAHNAKIDGCIFIRPRFIPFELTGDITVLQRPLRAQTPQGERVALAASEEVPAGSTQEFVIAMANSEFEKYVRRDLDCGEDHGTGQWRNSGHGRFLWEELDPITGEQIGGNYTPEYFELLYNDANCIASTEELQAMWKVNTEETE
jgi:hypothetical protein